MDLPFILAWAAQAAFYAALLTLAWLASELGRSLDGALETCEMLERNLKEEQRQHMAYRRLFAPPKDWGDDRAVTVLYRPGKGVSYATGRDLALRGFTPAPEESGEHPRVSEPPPLPRKRRG